MEKLQNGMRLFEYYNNYTYQKLIDGEMVTILENVSYAELSKLIDLTEWSEYAYLSLPIK